MLDTNIVSHALKNDPTIVKHLKALPPNAIHISAITRAELRYGLAKRPDATKLARIVEAFLNHVKTLDWTKDAADRYGEIRASIERQGLTLAPLDLQIAAHALAQDSILVTRDQAFQRIEGLIVETWTQDRF